MSFERDLRHLRWSPTIVAASLASNLFALALPLAMLQLYDRVIPGGGLATLAALGAGLLAAAAGDLVVRAARGHLIATAAAGFEASAHEEALERILRPGADPFWTGADVPLSERFAAIERLRRHLGSEAATALLDLPFVVVFLAVMTAISPALGLGALAITATALVVVWLHRRRIDRLQDLHLERDRRRHAFLAESVTGIEAIRGLGVEGLMERRYERLMAGTAEITRELAGEINYTQGLAGTISLLGPVLMSGLGSYLVVTGQMTVGGLAAGVLLTSRIIQPTLRMEALLAGERDTAASARAFDGLMAAPILSEGGVRAERIEAIEVEDVCWSPAPGAPPVIDGASLTLRRGDCVSIEGADGSGRSTLLALIAGHRRPDRGRIAIDGTDLAEIDPADLARRVSLLSPDHRMLPGTLFENLTALAPGPLGQDALALAREMGVDRAVAAHHEGYATRAVARGAGGLPNAVHDGVLLVAGLVGRPDVILFDEANSHLDARADRALLDVLRRRLPETITVLVTYRPSFKALANAHYELAGGQLRRIEAPPEATAATPAPQRRAS